MSIVATACSRVISATRRHRLGETSTSPSLASSAIASRTGDAHAQAGGQFGVFEYLPGGEYATDDFGSQLVEDCGGTCRGWGERHSPMLQTAGCILSGQVDAFRNNLRSHA